MALIPFQVIDDDIVLDRWSALVHRGRGHAGEVHQDALAFLHEVELPGLEVREQMLATSFLNGLQGNLRPFLSITAASASHLVVYLGAYDAGTSLSCHWYLTTRVGPWRTLLEKAPFVLAGKEPPPTLTPHPDLFTKDIAVRHFASATHAAMAQAVERLMERLGQNPARLDRRTGFQGIQ